MYVCCVDCSGQLTLIMRCHYSVTGMTVYYLAKAEMTMQSWMTY